MCVGGKALQQRGKEFALEGGGGGDDADDPGRCVFDGRLDRRLHADEGDVGKGGPQVMEGGGGGGVAGDDDDVRSLLSQEAGDALGKGAYFCERAHAVGDVGLVGHVEGVVLGQPPGNLAPDRQAADARVKEGDHGNEQ